MTNEEWSKLTNEQLAALLTVPLGVLEWKFENKDIPYEGEWLKQLAYDITINLRQYLSVPSFTEEIPYVPDWNAFRWEDEANKLVSCPDE